MEQAYKRGAEHQPVVHHYSLAAALVIAGMVVVTIAAYMGIASGGWFTSGSALLGLGLIVALLAVGLAYVLFTLHKALEDNDTHDRPYGLIGALTIAGILVVAALAYVSTLSFTAVSTSSALFGLAAIELVLAAGLCYLLFTLRRSLTTRAHDKWAYAWVGAAVLGGVAIFAVLAFSGVVNWGLFTRASAFFGAGAAALILAAGLAYILFTMKDAMHELAYQRAMPAGLGAAASATPAMASKPMTSAAQATLPSTVTAAAPTATAPTASLVTAATTWKPLPARHGEHAARTRHEPVREIEGIGPEYERRLKRLGISNLGQLKQANPAATAKGIGVHAREVKAWQSMADLMEINGVGKQFSELLVRSGFKSVDEVAATGPAKILAAAQETELHTQTGTLRQARIQGGSLSQERVTRWIEEANRIV